MKNFKIIFFVGILTLFSLTLVRDLPAFPVGLRHIYHLLFAPDDLYESIISNDFSFDIRGFAKTFELHPKYLDLYDLSISFLDGGISSKYKFSGKLLVEFLHDGNVVSKKIANQIVAANYVGNDMLKYNKITLMTFEIPIIGKFKEEISLRITVLEIDQNLKNYKGSVKLQVAVSSSP